MSRKPMTAAEFSAMPKITPTGYAEEAYQAKLRQRRPMRVGPAGLPVPMATAIYRKVEDGALLAKICRAAYVAHAARIIPRPVLDEFAGELRAIAIERWPQNDMQVLERYGVAKAHSGGGVEFGLDGRYAHALSLKFTEPMLAPAPVPNLTFFAKLGAGERDGLQVPAARLPLCQRAADLILDRKRFDDLQGWPGQFRNREGRWPRWSEIERQVPEVGEFLAEQRAAL